MMKCDKCRKEKTALASFVTENDGSTRYERWCLTCVYETAVVEVISPMQDAALLAK